MYLQPRDMYPQAKDKLFSCSLLLMTNTDFEFSIRNQHKKQPGFREVETGLFN